MGLGQGCVCRVVRERGKERDGRSFSINTRLRVKVKEGELCRREGKGREEEGRGGIQRCLKYKKKKEEWSREVG